MKEMQERERECVYVCVSVSVFVCMCVFVCVCMFIMEKGRKNSVCVILSFFSSPADVAKRLEDLRNKFAF